MGNYQHDILMTLRVLSYSALTPFGASDFKHDYSCDNRGKQSQQRRTEEMSGNWRKCLKMTKLFAKGKYYFENECLSWPAGCSHLSAERK